MTEPKRPLKRMRTVFLETGFAILSPSLFWNNILFKRIFKRFYYFYKFKHLLFSAWIHLVEISLFFSGILSEGKKNKNKRICCIWQIREQKQISTCMCESFHCLIVMSFPGQSISFRRAGSSSHTVILWGINTVKRGQLCSVKTSWIFSFYSPSTLKAP